MKIKNKNQIVIVIMILLITLAIGYAVLSDSVEISGTATGKGEIDVVFTGGSVPQNYGSVSVDSSDAKTLNVDVTLHYPGDGTEVTATIKNQGTVPVVLKDFTLYESNGTPYNAENSDLKITFPGELGTSVALNDVLTPNEECTVQFTVEWDASSQNAEAESSIEITKSFTAKFDYIQDVTLQPTVDVNTGYTPGA